MYFSLFILLEMNGIHWFNVHIYKLLQQSRLVGTRSGVNQPICRRQEKTRVLAVTATPSSGDHRS